MKILMVNSYSDGAGIVFSDLSKEYKKENEVDYIDVQKAFYIFPKSIRILLAKFLTPFYSLIYQLIRKYDLVVMNQNIVIQIGRNTKCIYKNLIHHPFTADLRFDRKKGIVERILLLNEKISIKLCKNILTVSKFSKKEILKNYPNVKCEVIKIPINKIFYEAKEKYKKEKKINAIFLPLIYRTDRKGGDFITPILIKLAPILKNKKIKLIITGKILESQKNNYNELCKKCEVKFLEYVSYDKLAKLYSTSLLVLTPATLEGYGLIPLEVKAAGGKCISAPFPSLGFDNISINNKGKKIIIDGIIVLEHSSEVWEKEILKKIYC
jgi:hypothetical protein